METVKVTGSIVPNSNKWIYDWLGIEATAPQDVENAFAKAGGKEVTIWINSGGGDVGAGNEIAYIISKYKGVTIAEIAGYCCSAATLVSCAADKARMMPSALYMIHNVSTCASGDHQLFSHEATVLKTASEAIAEVYRRKTGKSMAELAALMDNETWLNARQAKEEGFVDEIIEVEKPATLVNGIGPMLSEETIEKIRSQIKLSEEPEKGEKEAFLNAKKVAQINLELLRMKGEKNV